MVCYEIPFSGDSYDMEINRLICKKIQLTGFYVVRLFTGRYFQTDFNKQPPSIANYYLLACIIKHSLSPWGVFLSNITLRVLKNAEHKKLQKLFLRICLEFTNLGSAFFKARQQLFAIFYVAFYSIFVLHSQSLISIDC